MAGREQSHTSKPGMDPKPQGGDAVGRDAEGREVPDSKEKSTEIAVEEGRKGRTEHPDGKP